MVLNNLVEQLALLVFGDYFIEVSRQFNGAFCTVIHHSEGLNSLTGCFVVAAFDPGVYSNCEKLQWKTQRLKEVERKVHYKVCNREVTERMNLVLSKAMNILMVRPLLQGNDDGSFSFLGVSSLNNGSTARSSLRYHKYSLIFLSMMPATLLSVQV